MKTPLLTIAIPTYNRAKYLKLSLEQIYSQSKGISKNLIQVVVSDNCSTDNTQEVIRNIQEQGLDILYHKNTSNLGWGKNFLNCFNLATGKYVLLLGDDDLLLDHALSEILETIKDANYGTICLKPYGFNEDFRKETPDRGKGKARIFDDKTKYMLAISSVMRNISALIFNKELIKDIDTTQLIPGNFAHLHLIMPAMLRGKKNLYFDKYMIACKRNNSSNYDFCEIFVDEFWTLIDSFKKYGLEDKLITKLENKMLLTYYPFYMFKERNENTSSAKKNFQSFSKRFSGNWFFKICVAPILTFPKTLGLIWGGIMTAVGRTYNGELIHGITFIFKSYFSK